MYELVSIIVPIYNAEKYLNRCVDSIINQSYTNIEILLINDGSKDASEDICREYEKKDKRIVVISKNNGGVSSARNIGIEKSQGKYVMFVDADDFIERDMVKIMYDTILQNKVSMCISAMRNVEEIAEKNIEIISKKHEENNNSLEHNMKRYKITGTYDYSKCNCVMSSQDEYIEALQVNWAPFCKLINKELIKDIRYDESITIAEDLIFNTDIIIKNNKFKVAVCNEITYNYVDIPTSAMKTKYNKNILIALECEIRAYEELKKYNDNRLSRWIFNGVIVFFYKYAALNSTDKKIYKDDFKKVKEIVKKYDKYLLQKKDRNYSDRLKMKCIRYAPKLYIALRGIMK